MRTTFKVYERLKREQHIDTLFLSGKAFSVFPIRFVYRLLPPDAGTAVAPIRCGLQVGFSVPKKKFRQSVDRHRVRRLMAEAWRLNKQTLIDALPPGTQMHVFLVFNGRELPTYAQVLPLVQTGIRKLSAVAAPPADTPPPPITTTDNSPA